ncbi:reverse transcriptase domain-containing protein [Tanacetum coccineum]
MCCLIPPKRKSTSETPAITLAAIQQLIANGIATALEAQAATMANADNPNRNIGPREIPELAVFCPNMVPNTEKLMEVFICGLPRSIEGNVTASKPQTLEEATNIAQRLMNQIIRHDSVQETNNYKQKLEDQGNIINNNNYQNNYNNNNRNNDYHQQQNKWQETFKTYAATNGYTGNRPLCEICTLHHIGPCTVKCQTCNRVGHLTKNCRNKRPATRNNLQSVPITCNVCGEKGHYANWCSKANNRATGGRT